MTVEEKAAGRSVDDIVEAESGGLLTRAILLQDLEGAAYATEMEFAYDDEDVAVELLRVVKELRAHLERLSMRTDATLTLDRQCSRCSGRGSCGAEEPVCVECGGRRCIRIDGEEIKT